MKTVYIETTIPSYCTSRKSTLPFNAAKQESAKKWWELYRHHYKLHISIAVLEEISKGDPLLVQKRLDLVKGIPILSTTSSIEHLAINYMKVLGFPEKAAYDAFHLAYAVEYKIDYLLSWNLRHILNGEVILKLKEYNFKHHLSFPIILTTDELKPFNLA